MDAVTLDLHLNTIVGILARERINPQRLEASIRIVVDLDATARTGSLDHSVDYSAVDTAFRTLCTGGFLLIESLGLALLRWLLLPPGPATTHGVVTSAAIALRKPEVMPDALPGVHLHREAGLSVEQVALGEGVSAWVLAHLDEVVAWRVDVAEGARYTPPAEATVSFGDGVGPCSLLVVTAKDHPGLR